MQNIYFKSDAQIDHYELNSRSRFKNVLDESFIENKDHSLLVGIESVTFDNTFQTIDSNEGAAHIIIIYERSNILWSPSTYEYSQKHGTSECVHTGKKMFTHSSQVQDPTNMSRITCHKDVEYFVFTIHFIPMHTKSSDM